MRFIQSGFRAEKGEGGSIIFLAIARLIMYNYLDHTFRVEAKDSAKREVWGLFLAYGT